MMAFFVFVMGLGLGLGLRRAAQDPEPHEYHIPVRALQLRTVFGRIAVSDEASKTEAVTVDTVSTLCIYLRSQSWILVVPPYPQGQVGLPFGLFDGQVTAC